MNKLSIYGLLIFILFASSNFAHTTPSKAGKSNKTRRITLAMLAETRFQQGSASINHQEMIRIPSGTFMMGGDSDQANNDELPKHAVTISSFWLDKNEVTNRAFKQFVMATHYQTIAEKKPEWEVIKKQLPEGTPKPDAKKLVPASLVFTPPKLPVSLEDASQWWSWRSGANWQHPQGPNSSIVGKDNLPVVHVSWLDAKAFCEWQGKRLPTEAEWEWVPPGGLENKIYPWGNEPLDQGKAKANTWDGEFPYHNTLRDNFANSAPVRSFPPNGFGLYDMAGNVWEWVNDWYRTDYYTSLRHARVIDPQGPEKSYDPKEPKVPKKVTRGGSFLCSESYSTGYRVSSRMKFSPETTMEHLGFRCASSS